jgi:hypothetical protein
MAPSTSSCHPDSLLEAVATTALQNSWKLLANPAMRGIRPDVDADKAFPIDTTPGAVQI